MITHLVAIDSNTDYIPTISGWLNPFTGNLGKSILGADASLNDIEDNSDNIASDTLSLRSDVRALKDFFVNTDHKLLEQASEDSVDEATSMYQSSPNGNTTAQNNAAISGFSSDISSSFNTGVSSGDVFSYMNSGDPDYDPSLPIPDQRDRGIFAFFSNDTLYDLDPSQNSRSPQPEVVDYLCFNLRSIESHINGGSDR